MNESGKAARLLGILGGMSWVSTVDYYRLINEGVARAKGRQHSAPLLIASVDFQSVVDAQARGDWEGAGALLVEYAQGLEKAGAQAFLIASNTMHQVLAQVKAAVSIPALDIFDATATAITAARKKRVGLIGTRYTMSHPFYREAYAQRGIDLVLPAAADAKRVNDIIFRELIHGLTKTESCMFYQDVAGRLAAAGAEAVVLGCTEIGLILKQSECQVPLFDTAALHAAMAVRWLLGADDLPTNVATPAAPKV